MSNRLICFCNFVDEREINSILNKRVCTVADIQFATRAGTSCGRCLPLIDELIEMHKSKKTKDQQGELDFGF